MPKPEVSVIVVVYNEGEHIGKCIESVLDQSFGDLELILVDANSTDSTPEIIGGFSDRRIRYFRLKKRVNIPESRNIGLEKARGDYIFFTDADCTADRDWIMEGLGVLKREIGRAHV